MQEGARSVRQAGAGCPTAFRIMSITDGFTADRGWFAGGVAAAVAKGSGLADGSPGGIFLTRLTLAVCFRRLYGTYRQWCLTSRCEIPALAGTDCRMVSWETLRVEMYRLRRS